MSRQEAYGYSSARIRAMELRLLDAAAIQRMLDAEDIQAALKVLEETSYSASLAAQSGGTNYEKALEADLLATYEEISSFVPDRELVTILRLQYDFHNVKVMLKSAFNKKEGGKERLDLLTSLGAYPVDELVSKIETEEYALLPFGLSVLVPKAVALWEQNHDILEIERLLDKGLFAAMLQLAEGLGIPGVISWVRTKIDGENIRSLLRLKRFGYDSARALPFLYDGGYIDAQQLSALIAEPFESWSRAVIFSDLGAVLGSIEASNSFADLILDLEKALDEFNTEQLKKSCRGAPAAENALAYLVRKETEIKNIRMILVSKDGNDNTQVRRLLRYAG